MESTTTAITTAPQPKQDTNKPAALVSHISPERPGDTEFFYTNASSITCDAIVSIRVATLAHQVLLFKIDKGEPLSDSEFASFAKAIEEQRLATHNAEINLMRQKLYIEPPPKPTQSENEKYFLNWKTNYLQRAFAENQLNECDPATGLIRQISWEDFEKQVLSIELISNLPLEDAEFVVFTKGSTPGLSRDARFIQPTAPVCILQKTTINYGGKGSEEVCPYIFSVPAPILDEIEVCTSANWNGIPDTDSFGRKSIKHPEMETYLDTSAYPTKFREDKFRIAHQTLGAHIVKAADRCKAERVVLSAFGVVEALRTLGHIDFQTTRTIQRGEKRTRNLDTAEEIAAECLADTIILLRNNNTDVHFSDHIDHSRHAFRYHDYWDKVNAALARKNASPLTAVAGKMKSWLLDEWAKNTDLIINPLDPNALVGIRTHRDDYHNDFFRRFSIIHAVHAAAVLAYEKFRDFKDNSQI
jgi:hypothetical protein